MIDVLPPFTLYLLGALLLPFLPKGHVRGLLTIVVPVVGAWWIWSAPEGLHGQMTWMGLEMVWMRVDKLAVVFGLVFSLAAFLAALYAWHLRDTVQQVATLLYAGSAIGAVFAGDLVTLFLFWEGTAIASVFLIWARRTEGAYATGMRYLVIQISSGVILLGGLVLQYHDTGSIAFEAMTLGSLGTWAIFLSFGIKCAFPLLHDWLQDAYPAATVTGTVVLSAFTTKLAVYALARGFPGTEILIYIGAVMALFPFVYALIENDLRRVMVYSLNIQLGYMVVGVGIGTELALNGAAAHAFTGILYKALLFMGLGAVLFRTGTAKASELGGLYKTMPVTMVLCVIGAASISAFPLFSGFISKSLILSAAAHEHHNIVWAMLLAASAGALIHTGIKIPYFAFFGADSGKRPKEAPAHMLLAMGLTAALCIGLGVFPSVLYDMLPYEVDYDVYTTTHVITQLQLLLFSALGFALLMKAGIFPMPQRSVTLSSDWTYRKAGPAVVWYVGLAVRASWRGTSGLIAKLYADFIKAMHASAGPDGARAANWPTGAMVMNIAILLGIVLVVIFVS
ncbi:Na(+)/H(+) antiporter subunit D [Alphaproteobacteria bacterium KMM 3653]|uniref:Na(+)/H(+) antiporter subunit D n=1 Tax=Harenicola maris TaxID=2841044 RepID=A0AAP2CRA5_9RHOB|nr:Na(+)/H(+) antiporter subunit D [Harenicola maris]